MTISIDKLSFPIKVKKRIQETSDSVSLVLDIPAELSGKFKYQAGQFVTFFLELHGENLARSYSLSSAPSVDNEFKITVKKVPGGRASTYLCEHVKEGDLLKTTPPSGHFYKPLSGPNGTHLFLFAAGSGITPIYSILKETLKLSSLNRVTLVYCNRHEDNIIYSDEIRRLAQSEAHRFHLMQILTQPTSEWNGHKGRISKAHLDELLSMDSTIQGAYRQYYICGPTDYMNQIKQYLQARLVSPDAIRMEDFGGTTLPKLEPDASWTLIGPGEAEGKCDKIIATIQGENHEVKANADRSVLESLLEAGLDAPYSCMDGACMACMAKVLEGKVYQEDPGILTDENIIQNEALTCQAKPLSRIVRISYDNL